jgi:hypothetical protein
VIAQKQRIVENNADRSFNIEGKHEVTIPIIINIKKESKDNPEDILILTSIKILSSS